MFSGASFHFLRRGGNSASVGSVVQLATGTSDLGRLGLQGAGNVMETTQEPAEQPLSDALQEKPRLSERAGKPNSKWIGG